MAQTPTIASTDPAAGEVLGHGTVESRGRLHHRWVETYAAVVPGRRV